MAFAYSFKFVDDALNRELIVLLKKSRVKHAIDKGGVVHYSPDDEEVVGNDLIPSVRDQVFSPWQIISCPKNWVERYKRYMTRHDVPFVEELIDNQLCFVVPRKYRPHSWKLDEESESRPSSKSKRAAKVASR